MAITTVKSKRKVSCLPCRLKKVKCDGNFPCCSRCMKRDTAESCTYLKPGQVGRPPKNAVVNKLVLNRVNQTSSTFCKEFIFENVGYTIPTDAKFINNDRTKNLYYFIENFFNNDEAIMQIAVVRLTKAIPYLPDIEIHDILEMYTWGYSEMLNIVYSRLSSLSLDNFCYFDTIASAVFQDMALKFFSEMSPELPIGNPLTTLPASQATHLIETFFSISTHSILVNKTLLLQGYWTDTLDPLLLCVLYGTTIYLTRLLEGRPVRLWEAVDRHNRNPFLEYAYCLIQKASTEVSLARFQALTLLGLFESMMGFPRRGMATMGLAYMVGEKLGVMDNSFQQECNAVEAELATVAFWAIFNSTSRGCADLGQTPHLKKEHFILDLPPNCIERSISYKFEQTSGDTRLFRSYNYLVESFYIQSVVARFLLLVFNQLPEVKFNMFYPRAGRESRERRKYGEPKPHDLHHRLRQIMQEFRQFIQQKRDTWTLQQTYIIETVASVLDIHICFLKKITDQVEGVNYGNSAYDIFLDTQLVPQDQYTITRVQRSLSKAYSVVDKTESFLSDYSNEYRHQPQLVPRGLIVSALETCMEVFLLQHKRDPSDETTLMYLEKMNSITEVDIWTDWSGILTVKSKIKAYLKYCAESSNKPVSQIEGDDYTTTTKTHMETSLSSVFDSSWDDGPSITEITGRDDSVDVFNAAMLWVNPLADLASEWKLDVLSSSSYLSDSNLSADHHSTDKSNMDDASSSSSLAATTATYNNSSVMSALGHNADTSSSLDTNTSMATITDIPHITIESMIQQSTSNNEQVIPNEAASFLSFSPSITSFDSSDGCDASYITTSEFSPLEELTSSSFPSPSSVASGKPVTTFPIIHDTLFSNDTLE